MRAVILVLMMLLVGCDGYGTRRYELISASTGIFLLDTKTGRVWKRDTIGDNNFEPVVFLMDSSPMTKKAIESLDQETSKFIKENYTIQPNSWKDFFQGLGK